MSRVEGVSPLPRPLSRVLGLVFGLAVVVGGVIGSGIMRAPGVVAQGLKTEPLILLVWALGGGLAMLTAMPLVEAGSSVPRAGGAYPIAARAFGPTIGFLTGWLAWLPTAASSAFPKRKTHPSPKAPHPRKRSSISCTLFAAASVASRSTTRASSSDPNERSS